MYPKETVVGEFAGRDSIAAILKAFEEKDINYILPIVSYAPTEYGDLTNIQKNYNYLKQKTKEKYGDTKKLLDIQYYSSYELWRKINCLEIQSFIDNYKFYSPCIGCHMYFHLLKIPFASKYSRRVISGERISHDGQIKINQSEIVLNTYKNIMKKLGIELITPLINISDGDEIKDIIGAEWWEQGVHHLKCVYSGNYKDKDDRITVSQDSIKKYLDEYLYHIAIKLEKSELKI